MMKKIMTTLFVGLCVLLCLRLKLLHHSDSNEITVFRRRWTVVKQRHAKMNGLYIFHAVVPIWRHYYLSIF